MTAVDTVGALRKKFILHLVKHVSQLLHFHPVKVNGYPIQPPCILGCSVSPRISDWRHDSELLTLDLINHVQLIKDYIIPRLFSLYHCENPIALLIFWVSLSLKTALWEDSSVKIPRFHFLIELLQPFIFHLEQLLISRLLCHE